MRCNPQSHDARLRDFASRVAAVLAELETLSRTGHAGDGEFQKRLHGLIYELQGMAPDDLRALVAIFHTHPGIAKKTARISRFSPC